MKVDSKHILPFIDTLKALIDDCKTGFQECEEKEQCEDVFLYVAQQIQTVISSFKVDHLTPVIKDHAPGPPSFVRQAESMSEESSRTDSGERVIFMSRLYHDIKRKLCFDGVDHLYSREKIYQHIEIYLVGNDEKWQYYFKTELATAAYKVIDTVVNEIIEARRRNPQVVLNLQTPETKKGNKLVDLLGYDSETLLPD